MQADMQTDMQMEASGASAGESRYVSAQDGLRLHLRDYGPSLSAATTVVCLPGLARTAADFDTLARALAEGAAGAPRRVLALDYRGRGLSERDKNWRNYDLKVENADALTCLDAMGVARAIVVGTSRGGLHAMIFAATRPALLKAVVLNDIGPVMEARGLARIRGYVGRLPRPSSWPDAVNLLRSVMSAQFTALSPEEWDAYTRLTFEETDAGLRPRYDAKLMRVLESLDLETALPNLWPQFEGLARAPTLVLRGEHSDLLSPETVAEMKKRHPRCQAHTVAGQGHAPLLLDKATIDVVADFVRRADEGSAS